MLKTSVNRNLKIKSLNENRSFTWDIGGYEFGGFFPIGTVGW